MTGVAVGMVAAGVLLALGGAFEWVRRRRGDDVFSRLEPPYVAMPLRCICSARRPFCDCAIDGRRNPRGAGRARPQMRPAAGYHFALDEGGGP